MSTKLTRAEWFAPKWVWFYRLVLLGLLGSATAVAVAFAAPRSDSALIIAALSFVPLFFWLYFIPILHWRERYAGKRVKLWGAILFVETTGWSKIIYWFLHVLPDRRQAGRYQDLA